MSIAERPAHEKAGLDKALYSEWEKAATSREYDDKPGKLAEILTELWDWFHVSATPVDIHSLTEAEALAARREIDSFYDFASDVAEELRRVRFLGIGAERTAEQVLEDLLQGEREREELRAVAS